MLLTVVFWKTKVNPAIVYLVRSAHPRGGWSNPGDRPRAPRWRHRVREKSLRREVVLDSPGAEARVCRVLDAKTGASAPGYQGI